MGTITLKVPQDIHVEYQIDSSKMMLQLLDWLKQLKPQPLNDDTDFIVQMTQAAMPAREKHHDQTPSQQEKAYAEAMQDYLSRPAKPLKKAQESYPPREALYDRGHFC
ncbi:MAG: hypothetical protein VSS75_000495 [Candidatus Parabeggiatoa sp.]|nr:hypothetical protein [Candidatus Parabeggiatoa sp.]